MKKTIVIVILALLTPLALLTMVAHLQAVELTDSRPVCGSDCVAADHQKDGVRHYKDNLDNFWADLQKAVDKSVEELQRNDLESVVTTDRKEGRININFGLGDLTILASEWEGHIHMATDGCPYARSVFSGFLDHQRGVTDHPPSTSKDGCSQKNS